MDMRKKPYVPMENFCVRKEAYGSKAIEIPRFLHLCTLVRGLRGPRAIENFSKGAFVSWHPMALGP